MDVLDELGSGLKFLFGSPQLVLEVSPRWPHVCSFETSTIVKDKKGGNSSLLTLPSLWQTDRDGGSWLQDHQWCPYDPPGQRTAR